MRRITRANIKYLESINEWLENRKNRRDNKIWLSHFKTNLHFDYELEENLKIRLYKNSILSKWIFQGFENQELEFTNRFLKNGDIFFDIGANIGIFSIIASRKVGSNGKVFSFEPSPKTFLILEENIKLNNFTNVVACNIGISDRADTLKLYVSETGYDAWNSFAKGSPEILQDTVDVPVKTLANVLLEYGINNINLIKIDVEGWEKFVLMGGAAFFKNTSPVVLMEFTEANTFSAGYLVQELYDLMEDWGYKWFKYKDRQVFNEVKKLHYPYENLIAAKDVNIILNRLE